MPAGAALRCRRLPPSVRTDESAGGRACGGAGQPLGGSARSRCINGAWPQLDVVRAGQQCRRDAGHGLRRPGDVFAEGLHPADRAVSRRMPLLHLCQDAAPRRPSVPRPRAGARHRAGGAGRRLPRGAVHARRQAGTQVPGRAGGARAPRLREHPRLSRGDGGAGPRRDRPAAAPERGHHGGGRLPASASRGAVDGPDARVRRAATVRAGRAAFRFARQAAGCPPRCDPGGGRRGGPVHVRNPDRHRRDARGTHRQPARAPRAARTVWTHPGGDRAELRAQARHEDGRRARARARRVALDDRDGAACLRPRHEHPGAAEPECAASRGIGPGRHQRLGRGIAGHAGSCQSRVAVAASRGPARRNGARGQAAGAAADRVPGLRE